MFSTITMALSTSMPVASTRLNSTIMFSVVPQTAISVKPISSESGIASPTNTALRTPRNTSRTATTSTKPEKMLFSSSSIIERM